MFYSFEPFKKVFDILNKNIELNNINNIITYNIGLADKKERIKNFFNKQSFKYNG